uniref:C2H2-type domain-containing protein n=1 Tax=Scophthalmus maximus TaxID=52904 RepID=A0A8D2ZZ33_SCOMX
MFIISCSITVIVALCSCRCVLAASSGVLASILSSTGALVELQEPCLSGTVLALLLDYIYTGTLPYTGIQQHYFSLLSTACHLQMCGLQEALRAWQQTEANDADETNASAGTERQPYTGIIYTCSKHLPLTCSVDVFHRCDETDICSVQSAASSLEREDRQYLARSETCNEAQIHSASMDSCTKGRETCGASSINGGNRLSRKDVRTSRSISEDSIDSVNESNSRQVLYPTPRDSNQNIPCTAEVRGVSEEDNEVQKDQFHSTGTVKAEIWQKNRGDELVRTVEDRMNYSSSSSSSPLPCCGAVPVIRHSSRAAMHQAAAVSSVPPNHSVSEATVGSSRSRVPQSTGTENDNIVEGNTTKHKKHYGAQSHDYRDDKYHTGTQSWDFQNSSDQCAIQGLCYKSSTDQYDVTEQYCNSGNADYSMKHDDEHVNKGLSHITDFNNHHAHCDSFQNKNHTKHGRDDSVPQDKFCSNFIRGLRNKTELSFDDFPSKQQRLDWSDGPDVSVSAPAEKRSQDLRAVVPLPVEMSETGSDSHCEELCPEGENISEPHLSPTVPVDRTVSDPMYSVIGQTYHGHLYYHCLPQEDTHLLHRDTDHKHSHPCQPDYSDQPNEEKETGTCASAGHTSLRQHFAPGSADRVVLLDISATPAELLVSYRNSSDEEEKDITYCKNDTFGTGVRNNVVERRNGATPVAGVEEKKPRAESFGERETTSWVGETSEARKSVGGDQSTPGADAIHKDGVVEELSNPEEGENQSSTLPVCSPPSVPDCVQAPVSSTLSVCIPSTLSASTQRNISAHLSPPLHHTFQCSLCDRSFSQRGSLNRHVRSHLGVRPFPCPCCPMTFSRQYRVTEHMRVHQRCPQGNVFHKPPASSV